MLKVRVIPTLLYKDFGLVKGVGFDSWRRVGTALPAIKVYNTRQVDELILLDIAATPQSRTIDFDEVDQLADECFMPLTVGGGVQTLEDIRRLLRAGADKVAINSAAVANPSLIREAAYRFGSQCIVVSIDFKKDSNGNHEVFTHSGKQRTGLDPIRWAKDVESFGAGEILLTSVNRDGTLEGYDCEFTRKVTQAVSIPVIISGGAGSYNDLANGIIEGGASAVAAASMFHFTENTPLEAKRFLKTKGIPVRL